jgi:cyclic lactone autoinducer peptide
MIRTKIFKAVSVLLTIIGLATVSTASIWLMHQPKAPKSFQK